MRVALVCIAKNEEHYIKEWCDYHLKLGFDQIFIYQNDWVCDLEMKNVIKLTMDGPTKQMEAYNTFIKTYHQEFDWVAFFDVDEFLVLKKHTDVKNFISDYSRHDGIGINWVVFGSNNHEEIIDNNYSLVGRFTKRENGVDQHVKSIVKMIDVNRLDMYVHNPNRPIVNTNGNLFYGPFNSEKSDDIAQINHYFCKTRKEFEKKINRGRSDTTDFRKMEEFDLTNKNEVDDFTAYNFYIKK